LTARGSPYVVQVHGDLTTHAIDAVPELIGYSGPGPRSKPRYRTRPTGLREHLLAAGRTAAVQVRWRDGSRGPMTSAFVALHVRPAGRRPTGRLAADGSLPAVWLLAEWPPWAAEPTDYWLSTLPKGAGPSLHRVLHQLQALLATWTGTCIACGQRLTSHARAPA